MRHPITVTLDEPLLEAVRRTAARDGVSENQVVEDALRRDFTLRGLAVLDEIADRQSGGDRLSDEEALALAVAEIRAARPERRLAAGLWATPAGTTESGPRPASERASRT